MKVFKTPFVPEDQLLLLPPNIADLVPEDSEVRIFSELVDQLNASALYAPYKGGGAPAYDPLMLFKVMVFGSTQGMRSSRQLARALAYDVRFMYLSRMSRPDFHTIARFRRLHEAAIRALFTQSVMLANEMGLVLMEQAAVDGTKLVAHGSKRRYRRQEELDESLGKVQERIARVLKEMEEADAQEDEEHGDGPGDGIPEELRSLKARKERLEQAKKDLGEQLVRAVVMTDPESRMMQTTGGIRPAFNAQAVVDSKAQIIVAADVTKEQSDARQLKPMLEQAKDTVGEHSDKVVADGGSWSKDSLDYAQAQNLDAYIAPAGTKEDNLAGWTYDPGQDVWRSPSGDEHLFSATRQQHGRTYRLYRCPKNRRMKWVNQDAAQMQGMRQKVATPEGKAIYKKRQTIVEPVFGHLKGPYGLRKLLLCGLSGARIEYLLACTAHNLSKMAHLQKTNPAAFPA